MLLQPQKFNRYIVPTLLFGIFTFLVLPSGSVSAKIVQPQRVLVLSETAGWDHNTREVADQLITRLGEENDFSVTTTATTGGWFTDSMLSGFKTVCCINTTGSLFTDKESEAFRRYIENGGGFVGMHACTDAEYAHPWFGDMTGANFNGHPFNVAPASVAVINRQHPSTSFLMDDTLQRTDEWYFWGDNPDFRDNPLIDPAGNPDLHVLLTLVESSIPGSTLNHPHPICWYRSYGSGRVWYCGLGHDPKTYNDTLVGRMLLGGILYAMGTEPALTIAGKHFVLHEADHKSNGLFDLKGRRIYAQGTYQHINGTVISLHSRFSAPFTTAPGILIQGR